MSVTTIAHLQKLQDLGLIPKERPILLQPNSKELDAAFRKAKTLFFPNFSEEEEEREAINTVKFATKSGASEENIVYNAWLGNPDWNPPMEKWNWQSWGHTMVLYRLFLKGIVPGSPTHGGGLTKDVVQATASTLEQVVRLGFVTLDSQPGECNEFRQLKTGLPGFEIQREYIIGNFPTKFAKSLFDNLLRIGQNRLAVFVSDPSDTIVYYFEPKMQDIYQNLPIVQAVDGIPLTIAKLDTDTKWTIDTKMPRQYYEDALTSFAVYRDSSDIDPAERDFDESDTTNHPLYYLHKWSNDNTLTFKIIARDFCRIGETASLLLQALIATILKL